VTGLLRGELGFDGTIISDALEMRAVSGPYGIPEAAVMAIIAGVDLLCLGRDVLEDEYHAIVAAISDAARSGRLPAARLEEAADRVARLRGWLASARAERRVDRPGPGGVPGRLNGAALNGAGVGLQAARRAVRLWGERPSLTDPVVVEVEPRGNVAIGRAAWGLAPWAPAGSVRRIAAGAGGVGAGGVGAGGSVTPVPIPLEKGEKPAEEASAADLLAAAAGRSLVLVVRDAHRSLATQNLVTSVLVDRPDAVVVEMGLPVWRPAEGSFRTYLATYGAARVNAQAAAEILGLVPA
jgi:beta-N-acetylhexosaminidase